VIPWNDIYSAYFRRNYSNMASIERLAERFLQKIPGFIVYFCTYRRKSWHRILSFL